MKDVSTKLKSADGTVLKGISAMQTAAKSLQHTDGAVQMAVDKGITSITEVTEAFKTQQRKNQKLLRSTSETFGSIAAQMQKKLDDQASQLVEMKMAEVENNISKRLEDVLRQSQKSQNDLQHSWTRFAHAQSETRHEISVQRLEAIAANVVPSWVASERNERADRAQERANRAEESARLRAERAEENGLQSQFMERLLRQRDRGGGEGLDVASGYSNPRLYAGMRVRAERPRGNRPPCPDAGSPRRPLAGDANWVQWGPLEIKNWMVSGACDSLAYLLFPEDANKKPPVVIKRGSQLRFFYDDPNILVQIQPENAADNVALDFAKRTFTQILKDLVEDN